MIRSSMDTKNAETPRNAHCSSRPVSLGPDSTKVLMVSAADSKRALMFAGHRGPARASDPGPPSWQDFRLLTVRRSQSDVPGWMAPHGAPERSPQPGAAAARLRRREPWGDRGGRFRALRRRRSRAGCRAFQDGTGLISLGSVRSHPGGGPDWSVSGAHTPESVRVNAPTMSGGRWCWSDTDYPAARATPVVEGLCDD